MFKIEIHNQDGMGLGVCSDDWKYLNSVCEKWVDWANFNLTRNEDETMEIIGYWNDHKKSQVTAHVLLKSIVSITIGEE